MDKGRRVELGSDGRIVEALEVDSRVDDLCLAARVRQPLAELALEVMGHAHDGSGTTYDSSRQRSDARYRTDVANVATVSGHNQRCAELGREEPGRNEKVRPDDIGSRLRCAPDVPAQLEEPQLAAGTMVEHCKVDVVSASTQRVHALRDEGSEIGIFRPRVHLRHEEDAHRQPSLQRRTRSRSYSPHSSRSTPQISPTVHRARSASRIGTSRLASPRAVFAHHVERCLGGSGFALGANARGPLDLPLFGRRVEAVQLDLLLGIAAEHIDADDRTLARLDLLLPPERRRLDLALHEPLLDRRRPPRRSRRLRSISSHARRLELVGERLDVVGAAERVHGRGGPGLRLQDLLCAQRDRGGVLGRQRQRLVERVRVQRLRAAADRRQRLHRDPDDVVLRLLCRERRPAGLRMEAQRKRPRVRRSEALPHDPGPQPSRRAELRHLLEEVVVRVEEERQPLAERVGRETGRDRRVAVRDAVGEREARAPAPRSNRPRGCGSRRSRSCSTAGSARRSTRTDRSSAASTGAAGRCSCRARCTP